MEPTFSTAILNKMFRSFKDLRIMVIGDVMIDTYLWGKVERVSPEAPVPIVSDIIEENRLGGAANVALNVKALGAVPILCSVIGRDERGKVFLNLLEEQYLSDVGITVDDYRVTTQKTRVISGFKHLLRVDEEMENVLSKNVEEDFSEMVLNLIETGNIHAIIFQDYDKGVITPGVIDTITSAAREKTIPVMVDPKFRNFETYTHATIFKPNLKELRKGLQLDPNEGDAEKLAEAGKKFLAARSHENMLITLSDKGIIVLDGQLHEQFPAQKREVIDVSGAGDTVISVAAACYAAGLNASQAAQVANIAGGQVCEKSGVVPVNLAQLKKACKSLVSSE